MRDFKISVSKSKQEFALTEKVNELLEILKVELLKLQDDRLEQIKSELNHSKFNISMLKGNSGKLNPVSRQHTYAPEGVESS